MEITFLGRSCFRLRTKDVTLITDPYQSSAGKTPTRLQGEIVTISHDHPGHNNTTAVGGSPRIIQGPGEYEIRGVLVTGVATFHDAASGKERGRNTVYVIQMEDVRLCHLGDLGHILTTEQIDEIGTVDVVFVSARSSALDMSRTSEVISQIAPNIIIPMHFPSTDEDGLASIEKFCHEMGLRQIVPEPKLNVTKASIPQETQVVVLDVKQ